MRPYSMKSTHILQQTMFQHTVFFDIEGTFLV